VSDIEQIKELLPKISAVTVEDFVEHTEPQIDATPMSEENKEIGSNVIWEKAFHDLILEILDFDIGLVTAKTSFTNALLNAGSQYNPQSLYQLMDLVTTRLERIHLIKRLCGYLGLHNEMDKILEKEMDLIYKTPQYNIPKTLDMTNPIAGDKRNG